MHCSNIELVSRMYKKYLQTSKTHWFGNGQDLKQTFHHHGRKRETGNTDRMVQMTRPITAMWQMGSTPAGKPELYLLKLNVYPSMTRDFPYRYLGIHQ